MKDLKRAFGSPDPEFQSRVRQTLFRIEEKEETIVKKKLTFSMAMAMILCICIITVSALAGSALLTEKPDVTQPPLSHSENENPGAAPLPTAAPTPQPTPQPALTPVPEYLYDMTASLIAQSTEVFLLNANDSIYHLDSSCGGTDHPCRLNLLSAVWMGCTACTECVGDGGWFYTSETDPYFHPSADCCVGLDRPLRVTLIEAYALEKIPCSGKDGAPLFVWSAEGDDYYHAHQDCSAAHRAARVTLPVAENRRQAPCPACWASGSPLPTLTPMPTQVDIDIPLVYAAQGRSTFHYTSSPVCAENDGILIPLPLTDALSAGALPCRECLVCYTGEGNSLYHMSQSCSRLSSPQLQLVRAAVQDGCQPCGVCVCFLDLNSMTHHRFARCSAFGDDADANAYIPCSLNFPSLMGSAPCELCAVDSGASSLSTLVPLPTSEPGPSESPLPISRADSNTTVFLWDSNAPVYHAVYNCSGYEYLYQMELSEAVSENRTPCPNCILAQTAKTDMNFGSVPPLWSTGDSEFYFYDYTGGHSDCFHTNASCDAHPMIAPVAISLETAIRYELHPCPECSNLLEQVIISEPDDGFYHLSDECQPFSAPEYITRYEAKKLGFDPCPLCSVDKTVNAPTVSPDTPTPMPQETPAANTVYPSRSGDSLFHRRLLCGETVTAPSVSLIDALNTGLLPCPDCYGNESVYTVNGGDSYHITDKTCFIFLASSSHFADVSLTEALLRNKRPCGKCVLNLNDAPAYYYTPEDQFYHYTHTCLDKGYSVIGSTSESELIEMGKNPCKKCMPPEAYGYVFSSESGAFYHLYDDCVGADVPAPRVPISVAKARLQTACPNCTGDPDYVCLISDASAFYHVKDVLHGVPDAVSLSRAVTVKKALDAGKNPCICMGLGASSEKTMRECRADLFGEVYYYSVNGEYYHLESICGINEYPDLLRGAQVHEKNLSPCPACLPNRQKTNSLAASVDDAASHGITLSDEETASAAR